MKRNFDDTTVKKLEKKQKIYDYFSDNTSEYISLNDTLKRGEFIVSSDGKTTRFWSVESGNIIKEDNQKVPLSDITISSNGYYTIYSYKDCIRTIFFQKIGVTIEGHNKDITSVDISSNNEFIVSASKDCTIRIRGLYGFTYEIINTSHPAKFIKISQDSKFLFALVNGVVKIYAITGKRNHLSKWESNNCRIITRVRDEKHNISHFAEFPNSGNIAYTTGKTIKIRHPVATDSKSQMTNEHTEDIENIKISPDERFVVTTSKNEMIIWNTNLEFQYFGYISVTLSPYKIKSGLYSNATFSPDSKSIIYTTDDTIHIYSISEDKDIKTFKNPSGNIKCIAI